MSERPATLDDVDLRAVRRRGVGGSDVAAVVGLDPWRTAHDLWMEKLGLVEREVGEAAYWGQVLEPLIAAAYAERQGVEIYQPPSRFVRGEPWMIGHIDYYVKDQPVGVDCKMTNPRQAHRWGEPGTDEVPDEVLTQTQWYLRLHPDFERWDIPVLMGGRLLIYAVRPNRELQEMLVGLARTFWFEHVLAQVAPPVDASASARRMLERLWPRDLRELRPATPDELDLAANYQGALADLKEAKTRKYLLANNLREAIGDAAGFQGPGVKVTWKTPKDRRITNWEAVARALWFEIGIRFDNETLADKKLLTLNLQTFEGLITTYTRTEPSTRRLVAHFEHDKEGRDDGRERKRAITAGRPAPGLPAGEPHEDGGAEVPGV